MHELGHYHYHECDTLCFKAKIAERAQTPSVFSPLQHPNIQRCLIDVCDWTSILG